MEFNEFNNPEGSNYDINSSLNYSDSFNSSSNPYSNQLTDLIGILEDISEEELQEQYGISMNEYLNPNAETISKVEKKLNEQETVMHR